MPVGERLISDVKASQSAKGLRDTGASAASLRAITTRQGTIVRLQLLGLARWRLQQNGRGPNKSGKPSRAQVEGIKAWLKRKGLTIPAYAIAVKQAREGTRVPNPFNSGGVLSEPLNAKRVTGFVKTGIRSYLIQSAKSILFSNG